MVNFETTTLAIKGEAGSAIIVFDEFQRSQLYALNEGVALENLR
ncbi:MAG TPA: hypothetical protein VJS85_08150 [Rhizomicrobium sp.]|nr:hypothetical protein [Rhizomicrobium sp.]